MDTKTTGQAEGGGVATPPSPDLFFRRYLDNLPNAAYTCDAEGLITYYNPRAVEVWGREPRLNDPVDRFCGSFKLYAVDGTPLNHDECWMALALRDERGYLGEEIIVERPDGQRLTVLAHANPIHDEGGRLVGAVNTLVDITERKQAENQLSGSEQELADAFENAPIGMHWVGPDGTILRANQAELNLLGYARDEYVGRHIADFHVDKDAIDDILRRLTAGEELRDYEARLRCKDGSIRHGQISSNVLWANGKFIHTRCFTRDVTERKQAEEVQARLAAIVASSDDAIVGKDLNGIVRSWNRAAEQLFGYTAEEIIGQSITLIIPPDRLDEEATILGRLRNGERIEHFETIRRRKDGGLLEISLTVSPIVDSQGHVVGASKIARDITEHKRAERRLQEQANTLATINHIAATLSAELDLERLVQAVTDAGTELSHAEFGAFFYNVLNEKGESYTLYTLSGAPREAFSNFPMPRNTKVFAPTFGGKGVVRSDDIRNDPRYGHNPPYHGMPEGHLPVCSYLAAPVVSRSGEVLGGLFFGHSQPGMFTDQAEEVITALASHAATAIDNAHLYEQARRLNETLEEKVEQRTAELKALNAELEAFNYSVSHDLRTPLRGINGYSQVLLTDYQDKLDEDAKHALERIRVGSERMASLIDSLLDLSRLSRVEVRPEPVDLGRIARSLAEDLRERPDGHDFRVDIQDDLKAVGDRALMRIALENLLTNAYKFTCNATHACLKVGKTEADGETVFYVRDNGAGFDMRFADKLFKPFQRLHSPGQFEGTGIGLTIVERVIHRHGGRIWAEGAPGQGATFYFTLASR